MAEPSKLRLILIDERTEDRALARLVLERAIPGVTIQEVENAEDLTAAIRRGKFDLVITECLMSWTDGMAIWRVVSEAGPQTPVVAFTELRDEELVVEAMKEGFADFVFKGPKGFLQLPAAVQAAWERARDRLLAARSQPWLGTLLDRSNIGAYRSTLDGRLVEATPTLFRLLGVTDVEGALRMSLPESHFDSEEKNDLLARLNSERSLQSREVQVHGTDGSIQWLNLTEVLLIDIDEEIVIDALVQDISQVKNREEELSKRVQELERSNADLSQFAYMASHELQQPLRMAEKFGAILAEDFGSGLGDDGGELLQTVIEGVARMQDLVDDLLALSRIDTEGMEIEPINSNEVLHEAILGIEDQINENEARIHSDQLPSVAGDYSQLVQLWRNLISNAIKFRSQEAPKIAISARETASEWVFSIEDNGLGIESQELENIFDLFRRLHPELPGTGIGLSMCRRIVERHGGRLWAEDRADGGARFSFSIPKSTSDTTEGGD